MTSSDFTLELAISFYESKEPFPIDMWEAGEWLGYSRKDSAKRFFMGCCFIKDRDYQIHRIVEMNTETGLPNYRDDLKLSVDCFKMWGMMAKNEQGRKVREYFIRCEDIAKEAKAQKDKELNSFIHSHARIYKPEFPKEFYDELYRVTGYSKPKRGKNPYMAILVREYIYGMFGQEVLDEIDRVNPIIGYHTYNVPKATPKQISSIKAQIRGNRQAAKHYLEKGKIGKSKKAQKKVEQLERRLVRWSKPHSLRLPKREFMHHQFCSDLIGLPSLQAHVQTVITVMRTLPSDDTDRFHEAMESAFPNGALKNVSSIILDIPLISA